MAAVIDPNRSAQDALRAAIDRREPGVRPRPIRPVGAPDVRAIITGVPDREPGADADERASIQEEACTSAEDPLRGLKYLGPVAVIGRDAILTYAMMPIVYLWQDIAVAGTIVLIAGPPAEGKTTLLFLIFAARMNTSEAVSLLGRRVEPAPVGKWLVLIEGEHSDASTARKLVKSLRLLGLDDSGLDRCIVVARKAVRLHSPEWMDVRRLVSAGLVSDIGVDTVARVAPADANDEGQQVAIYDEIARTIELSPDDGPKPTAWLAAHTRKNGTDGGLGDVSGSAQRTGQADSVLMIKGEKVGGRTVSTTVTFAKLREDPDEYPMPVTFSVEKRPDGTSHLHVTDAGNAADGDDDRPLEDRIVDALRGGAKTKAALAKTLGRSWKAVDDAITTLFGTKTICTGTPKKVNGRDYPTFELRGAITLARRCVNPGDALSEDFEDGGKFQESTRDSTHDSASSETVTRPMHDQ